MQDNRVMGLTRVAARPASYSYLYQGGRTDPQCDPDGHHDACDSHDYRYLTRTPLEGRRSRRGHIPCCIHEKLGVDPKCTRRCAFALAERYLSATCGETLITPRSARAKHMDPPSDFVTHESDRRCHESTDPTTAPRCDADLDGTVSFRESKSSRHCRNQHD